jgi:transposase
MHPKSGPRRRHSDELKAKVVAACGESGASISGVALAHGLNANLVRKWRCGRGAKLAGTGTAITSAPCNAPLLCTTPEFVAIEMPARAKTAARAPADATVATPIGEALIQIELRRGALHLSVRWPTMAAEDCRAWLSELSSSLLK